MRRAWLSLLAMCLFAAPAGAEESLRILVFGATGSVGSLIVDEALSRGHQVTAVSRDPSSIDASRPGLTAAKGDLLDRDSIGSLFEEELGDSYLFIIMALQKFLYVAEEQESKDINNEVSHLLSMRLNSPIDSSIEDLKSS